MANVTEIIEGLAKDGCVVKIMRNTNTHELGFLVILVAPDRNEYRSTHPTLVEALIGASNDFTIAQEEKLN